MFPKVSWALKYFNSLKLVICNKVIRVLDPICILFKIKRLKMKGKANCGG